MISVVNRSAAIGNAFELGFVVIEEGDENNEPALFEIDWDPIEEWIKWLLSPVCRAFL